MTKQITVVDVSSFTTDAKFRAWGLAMSTAMQASGLVLTSDTGQINWASVTKPAGAGTKAGYEIYRFADSLQATKPVFIRIDYGTATSASAPGTWLTVGTSTDGAGTITGVTPSVTTGFTTSVASTNTGMSGYFTHTSNGHCYMNFGQGLTAAGASSAGMYVVTRTVHPTTGVKTGDGLVVGTISQSAGVHVFKSMNFNTGTAYSAIRLPGLNTPLATSNTAISSATGSSIPLFKAYVAIPNLYPISSYLGYVASDISSMSTFTATPYGTTHTYLTIGGNGTLVDGFSTGTYSIYPAVIWED